MCSRCACVMTLTYNKLIMYDTIFHSVTKRQLLFTMVQNSYWLICIEFLLYMSTSSNLQANMPHEASQDVGGE